MTRHPNGPLMKLPCDVYSITNVDDAVQLSVDTNRMHLEEDLINIIDSSAEHAAYVWFGQGKIYFAVQELVDTISIDNLRRDNVSVRSVITKSEHVKQRAIGNMKRRENRHMVLLILKYLETKHGLELNYNDYLPYLRLEEKGDEVLPEDIPLFTVRGNGRGWGNFIYDRPAIPSGMVSLAALSKPTKEWCAEHFYARQNAGEHIYKAIARKATYKEVKKLCLTFQQVHYVTSAENNALRKYQKEAGEDFANWEPMYRSVGIELVKLVERKNGYASVVEYNGEEMTVTDFFQIVNLAAA